MILISLILCVLTVYLYLRYVYSYWSRIGFPYLEPSIPIGNLGLVAKGKKSFGENFYELYKQTSEPFIGIYLMFKPTLLVRDASLLHRMLVTDFSSFHDRGVYCNPKYDPMSENLFAMTGSRWRAMRATFTPTFTLGKLKAMLPIIMDQGDRVMQHLEKTADEKGVVETKDLMSRYALNVIGSVIFGLEVDTIANPDDNFRSIEKQIRKTSIINVLKGACVFLCPKVLEFLNLNSAPQDVQDYMVNIVKSQIEFREQNNVSRKDFIQILIQLRNNTKIIEDNDSWDVKKSTSDLKSMTIEQCAAQVFVFYVAGFDSTATSLSFTLYELARNPDIQRKIQEDIDVTLRKHDGQLTYESILDMKYVDNCIMETFRKYPALPFLNRECTIDYPIPGTKHTIKKGTSVIFSLLGLSRDPEYFPDPETYRPERFSDPEPTYNTNAFIPFGEGPRSCIALRLGKISVQIGIIKLLEKYNFELIDDRPREFDNLSVTLQIKGGVHLRVSHRNK